MSATSVQYQDDEKQAMARAAVTLLARWGVSDDMADPPAERVRACQRQRTCRLAWQQLGLQQFRLDELSNLTETNRVSGTFVGCPKFRDWGSRA
jgi:hypothetical protein